MRKIVTPIEKREMSDHSDLNYSVKPTPIEYLPVHKLGLNDNHEQEVTKHQKREIACRKRDLKLERNRKERLAYNFGFTKSLNGFDAYECYRADMRTQHDVYRKPERSKLWAHNSLWNRSLDTTPLKDYTSKQLRFKSNNWLKKISWFELKHAIKEFNICGSKWINDSILLPDANSLKNKPVKIPCKSITMLGLLDDSYHYLQVKCFSVKGISRQYYIQSEIKLFGLEDEFTPKKMKHDAKKMETNQISWFDKYHHSRYSKQISSDKSDYDSSKHKAYMSIYLRQDEIAQFFSNKPVSKDFDFDSFLKKISSDNISRKIPVKPKKDNGSQYWLTAKSDEIFFEKFRVTMND